MPHRDQQPAAEQDREGKAKEKDTVRPATGKEMPDWVEKDISSMRDEFEVTLKDGTVVSGAQIKKNS